MSSYLVGKRAVLIAIRPAALWRLRLRRLERLVLQEDIYWGSKVHPAIEIFFRKNQQVAQQEVLRIRTNSDEPVENYPSSEFFLDNKTTLHV
jgi:hypothetical protein